MYLPTYLSYHSNDDDETRAQARKLIRVATELWNYFPSHSYKLIITRLRMIVSVLAAAR